MLTINYYSGNWQTACRPTAPRLGSCVRIHESADDREYHDFIRCVRQAGMDIDFDRWMPRAKLNIYKLVKRG